MYSDSISHQLKRYWLLAPTATVSLPSSLLSTPNNLNKIIFFYESSRYNELELRVTFLMCRDTWLLNSLSSIPDSNAYSYVCSYSPYNKKWGGSDVGGLRLTKTLLQLNKLIDQSRTHLFDIIHQYKAIFSDDSSSHDDVNSLPFPILLPLLLHLLITFYTQPMKDGGLLYGWISQKIMAFMKTLDRYVMCTVE